MSNLNGGLSGSGTLRGTLGGGGVPAQDVYWDDILNKPNFATVATSGSYNDLTDKPTIPAAQVNADWNATSGVAEILNKPTIPAAQVNADWNATSGVAEILNKPTLAPVATSGSYNDLTNTPTIPAAQVNADWNATSGVAEILNKPTIPAAQVNADWNAASGVAEILNKPTIPTTASQIEYDNTTSGLQADDVQGAITELKSNLTVLDDRKIYKVSTSNTLSGGYVTRDLGSDFGDTGTYYCIGASAYIANNAQVVVACAVQQGRYIRMGMHWNNSYSNSAVTLTYYYVKISSLGQLVS